MTATNENEQLARALRELAHQVENDFVPRGDSPYTVEWIKGTGVPGNAVLERQSLELGFDFTVSQYLLRLTYMAKGELGNGH